MIYTAISCYVHGFEEKVFQRDEGNSNKCCIHSSLSFLLKHREPQDQLDKLLFPTGIDAFVGQPS